MAGGSLDFETRLKGDTTDFINAFRNATQTVAGLGNGATASAESLQQMSEYGRKHIQALNLSLASARTELVHLSNTNATPADIENARKRIEQLENAIQQTTTVFNGFGAHAQNAMQEIANSANNATTELTPLQQQVSRLVGNLDSVRLGLDQSGNSATHTRAQLEQLAQNATVQLQLYEQQLESARLEVNRLSATNASPADIQRAQQEVRNLEIGVEQVTTSLRGFENASRTATNDLTQGVNRSNSALDRTGRTLNTLQGAMAALGIGFGVHEIAQIADAYQNIAAQVKLATDNTFEFASAMLGIQRIANETTTGLAETANLFARISQAGQDLGLSQQNALDITRTINQSIQISGASAEASNAAITQLIQGLQSGVLRGEEFNSMMEQAPRLATALANSLNVTKGELRDMAGEGKLSSEVVIKALQNQANVINEEYKKIPTTISGAIGNIKNNFTLLIGEIDSTNEASKGIVNTLLMLSENLGVLQTLFNDVTTGVAYFSERLASTDPSVIMSVKNAVVTAYEAIKILISNVVNVGEVITDAFSTGLNMLFGWTSVVNGEATESVNAFSAIINGIAIAIGAVSDGVNFFGIGVKLLAGIFYDVAAAVTYYTKMLTWGDVRAKLDKDYQILRAQRDKYYAEAEASAMAFESQTRKALDNSVLNETQANQKKLADHKETFAQITAASAEADKTQSENNTKRTELNKVLAQARLDGEKAVVASTLSELDKLDLADEQYQKDRAQRNADKLKEAEALVEAEMKANKGVLSGLTQQELLRQNIIATVNEQGKAEVALWKSTEELAGNAGLSLEKIALKAAKSLGVDVPATLNEMSKEFKSSVEQIDNVAKGFDELKAKGVDASALLYASWLKWLETAKSQTEVDYATERLKEFGQKGLVSTQQVEQGMQAIRQVVQQLPADLDPVEQAFERLGIKTKEQLKLAAQSALADFNTIRASGQATAEDLQKAYERTVQAAHASGDAATIANANAKASSLGLKVQVDETGKASVESMDAVEKAVHRVRDSAHDSVGGFRAMGNAAREAAQEAKHSIDQWNDALTAKNEAQNAERKERNANRKSSFESYSRADVLSELKGMGYDDAQAKKFANSIMSSAFAKDDSAALSNYGTGNANMLNSQFEALRKQGLTSSYGTDEVRRQLANLANGTGAVSVDTGTKSTRRLEISNGNSTAVLTGSDSDVDVMEQILSEFEMLKKST